MRCRFYSLHFCLLSTSAAAARSGLACSAATTALILPLPLLLRLLFRSEPVAC
jgi:hypothetical protein